MARGEKRSDESSPTRSKSNGLILYRGPSLLDQRRIVAVLTGLRRRSRNPKTGAMLQTWILRDRIPPIDAVRTGADISICGECPLRSSSTTSRRCYVNVGQAPLAVYQALRNRSYPRAKDSSTIAAAGSNRAVRLGSYGDPAAVPTEIWTALVSKASSWTGYTHQWRNPTFDARLLDLCMASIDDRSEIAELHAKHPSARYFRVRQPGTARARGEMQCPASAEAGHRLTCEDCGACKGRSSAGRSVSLEAHGAVVLRAWRALD